MQYGRREKGGGQVMGEKWKREGTKNHSPGKLVLNKESISVDLPTPVSPVDVQRCMWKCVCVCVCVCVCMCECASVCVCECVCVCICVNVYVCGGVYARMCINVVQICYTYIHIQFSI